MSQIKAYNPEVALKVGIQASLLLQHIKFWIEEYNLEKVYRTNKQISEDFKGTLSESQIQRAKKKLVDEGLVIVSHDKGHTRTTHYKLTEKAMELLSVVKKVVEKVKECAKKVSKLVSGKTKPAPQTEGALRHSKSMEEEFKKAGVNKNAIAMPKEILEMLGKAKPVVVEEPVVEEVVEQASFVSEEHVMFDNYDDFDDQELSDMSVDSDDYFKALDFGIQQCQQPVVEEPKMTFAELLSKSFGKVPNVEVLEKNRKTLEDAKYFKEDY